MSLASSRLPVFLLTGFLGSGKTTLLKSLLRHPELSDTAILINEFGEVGLDHDLLGRIDETVVLLRSGCVCCTIRDELASALKDLLTKRADGVIPPFKRVVIETTGLADPSSAIATLSADRVVKSHFRLEGVATTFDAVSGRDTLLRQPESAKQVITADRIVLTKSDIVGRAEVSKVRQCLRELNPEAMVFDANTEGFDARSVFGERSVLPAMSTGMRCLEVATSPGDLHGTATSFAITADTPVDWTAFTLWLTLLLNRHGDQILRVKALLNLTGFAQPVAVHGVQHVVHPPTHLSSWPSDDRRSRIVFITRGLDVDRIARSVRAFKLIPASV
jgi:G3E family GTPase